MNARKVKYYKHYKHYKYYKYLIANYICVYLYSHFFNSILYNLFFTSSFSSLSFLLLLLLLLLCYVGYFSSNGFTPGCQACPIGTSTIAPGMSVCDICDDGYYGRLGEPPCAACPTSSMSNDKRTVCIQCIGYEPGCTQGGGGGGGDGDGSSSGLPQTNFSARLLLLEKKIKAQQSYIERYKKQRNQAEL